MAESLPFGRSLDLGSDNMPDTFCEPCHEVADEIKPTVGYCQNCNEDLCIACYTGHLRRKIFSGHKLVDKSTKPKTKRPPQTQPQNLGEECLLHHGKTLQSFCQDHSQVCCKVCLTINHQGCHTEDISKLARNIQNSEELKNFYKKFGKLNEAFNDVLGKTAINEATIQKNHQDAINETKKLRDKFDKLMTETEDQIEKVKEEELKKIEKVSETCDIVTEQLNNMSLNLDTLQEKGEAKKVFIAMKRAESQFKSLDETFDNLQKDNTVRKFKFEPDEKLEALLQDLKALGNLSFQRPQNTTVSDMKIKQQMAKTLSLVKDMPVISENEDPFHLTGSLVLPNNQILITDFENKKLKLIHMNNNKIISSIQLTGKPNDITKVKEDDIAVTVGGPPSKIQFISVSKNTLSLGRDIKINGQCWGIAHNEKNQTLVMTYINPGKVEILDMAGTVIKRIDKDSKGNPLFAWPLNVVLCPNMTDMYITDYVRHTVTLMSMNGDVKAVYKDNGLQKPRGICVHKSGLLYVVGQNSNSVHQLDPVNGKFKLLLDKNDGLDCPISISYCHTEDKMYIGMGANYVLKVFQMK